MSEFESIDVPAAEPRTRTLLLVDDEENILAAMKRLLRREGYEILTASSGERGLQVLEEHAVDVIVSDQRMPGMTGVEFLRQARVRYPDTIRVVLSGYTELNSITDAINEGAIYKFLTKPWDDEQLRGQIAEAFRQKELVDDNRRLGRELQIANARLSQLLAEREAQIGRHEMVIAVLHEVLEMLPRPFLGVDDKGLVVSVNASAEALFGSRGMLVGMPLGSLLPEQAGALLAAASAVEQPVTIGNAAYVAQCRPLSAVLAGRGKVITLAALEISDGD